MNFEDVYSNIFSTVDNYCSKVLDVEKETKHAWLVELANEKNFKSVVDIGCGTGAMLNYFKDKDILAADLNNFLIYDLPFIKINLMGELCLPKKFDLVICCDVIEHLPEPKSVEVLDKIKPYGNTFLLAIANHSDIINDIELHLTQKDKNFWDAEIQNRFRIIKSNSFIKDRLYMYILESI